jgi:transmembrane sensor
LEKNRTYLLISKYLAGEASNEEIIEVQKWMVSTSDNKKLFDEMEALWKETLINDKLNNQQRVLDKLLNSINDLGDETLNDEVKIHPITNKSSIFKYGIAAASLIFLLVSGYLLFVNQHKWPLIVNVAESIIKTNPIGQKSRIFLQDGSTIWLNAESTLKYDQEFGSTSRILYLEGEAYFEVAKSTVPFEVHLRNLKITALGTAFNVSAYPEDDKIIVALIEGKVSIQGDQNLDEILNPNEYLVIDKNDKEYQKLSGSINHYSAWKDGILSFEGDHIMQVIGKLERWYGIKINIKGTPGENLKFTGRFINEYLVNVLESMKYGQQLEYRIENKNVTLVFN